MRKSPRGAREPDRSRGLTIHTGSKTGKVEKTANGVKVEVETPKGKQVIEAETMLVSIGVLGNVENLFADSLKVELFKNHIKVDPKNGYQTNVKGIYAVGDIIGPPGWPTSRTTKRSAASSGSAAMPTTRLTTPTSRAAPSTDPGVASVGLTERGPRAKRATRYASAGSRSSPAAAPVASDETEGFVKLVFDAKYGELLGSYLLGSQATELIAELVMAKKLEATQEEIIQAMHPHPTYSEAVMEAAAQGLGESVHI